MDNWDFELFREKLRKVVEMFHKDKKTSKVETYMDIDNKEYKIIIEEHLKEKE